MREHFYVIAFDVFDNRRRHHLSRLLEGLAVRAQESVFEAWLTELKVRSLMARAAIIVDEGHDLLVCYTLTRDEQSRVMLIGCGSVTQPSGFIVL